jgi:hypothetical protein
LETPSLLDLRRQIADLAAKLRLLLCPRCERPRHSRTAEKPNKFAPSHMHYPESGRATSPFNC